MTPFRPKSSDPEEQRLREIWHNTKERAEAGETGAAHLHATADARLARYLWKRAEAQIAADRAKHPKAKRNQPFTGPQGQGRSIP